MREVDEEIREIKKEIIESRGLIIKTNNLTNSLAADIKSIAKRQAGYERRFYVNSAVAYVLFATLCFVGLKLASDARIREAESEKVELASSVRDLRQQLAEETRRAESKERAETKAERFYDMIRQQKRQQVVDQYEQIHREPLSTAEAAFFRDTVQRFRLDLSVQAYQNGLELMRTGRYAEATEQFQEAIRLKDEAAHIPAVKYNLGRALSRLGRHGEGLLYARQVVEQTIDPELQDDAMWLVSQTAEQLDDIDQARDALRTILRRWPRSSLVPDARRHLSELNLRVLRGRQAEQNQN